MRQRPLVLPQRSVPMSVLPCVLRNVLTPRSGDSQAMRAIRQAVAVRLRHD